MKLPWYIANITSSRKFGVRLMLFRRVILRDWTAISILPALPSGDLQTFRKAENSHIQWISRVPFFQRVPCIVSRKHQEWRSKHQAAKLCVAPFTCQIWSRFWRGGTGLVPKLDEVWNVCHFQDIHVDMHWVASNHGTRCASRWYSMIRPRNAQLSSWTSTQKLTVTWVLLFSL